jgi:hypothetical protein
MATSCSTFAGAGHTGLRCKLAPCRTAGGNGAATAGAGRDRYPKMLGPSMRPCGSTSTCSNQIQSPQRGTETTITTMPKAAHDHPDSEKFCNDLKGSKSCKMSEWPLTVFQDFLTSKPNTSRPLHQTATISECRYWWLRVRDLNLSETQAGFPPLETRPTYAHRRPQGRSLSRWQVPRLVLELPTDT